MKGSDDYVGFFREFQKMERIFIFIVNVNVNVMKKLSNYHIFLFNICSLM